MKIKPDFHFSILREEDFARRMPIITEQLTQCRKDGFFEGFDKQPLYYEYFLAENSRGAVIIVHGLTEFTRKYYEMAWYLLNQGYDVFLYDQRCHGRSCRLTDRADMIHVDHFSDYRKDLHRFVCDVVQPVTDGPLYLYGFSMGGAVAAQYLAKYPAVFQKAVLCAPMIQPLTGNFPVHIAHIGLSACLLFGKGKKKSWTSGEYDPNYPFERSSDKSRARFCWNMEHRHQNPCYCTTPQTIRWVQQSVGLHGKLTSRSFLKKIKTPILMLCAENDGLVCTKAQQKFAERCPVCQRIVLPGSTHAILSGTQETITACVQQVLQHFGKG
jgi:lysophospholipase